MVLQKAPNVNPYLDLSHEGSDFFPRNSDNIVLTGCGVIKMSDSRHYLAHLCDKWRQEVLKQEHIDWYRTELKRATQEAFETIQASERIAHSMECGGCMYCQMLIRHKQVLRLTSTELLCIINILQSGSRSKYSFPKTMHHDSALYRGFILDTGEYVDLFNSDHEVYHREYAERYGADRAFRMIKVHSSSMKNKVHFFDRKYPPTTEQFATLKELMIDARGELDFRFVYESRHPCK